MTSYLSTLNKIGPPHNTVIVFLSLASNQCRHCPAFKPRSGQFLSFEVCGYLPFGTNLVEPPGLSLLRRRWSRRKPEASVAWVGEVLFAQSAGDGHGIALVAPPFCFETCVPRFGVTSRPTPRSRRKRSERGIPPVLPNSERLTERGTSGPGLGDDWDRALGHWDRPFTIV